MKQPRRFRKPLILSIAAVAIAAGITWFLVWNHRWPTHRFAEVQAGVLYRALQPGEAGLRHIIRRYHIKTVVNLRGPDPSAEWYRRERQVCSENNVRLIDVQISSQSRAASGFQQFLSAVTDPSDGPVFVHCEFGRTRTGVAVAAYRIVAQKWSFDQAWAEALSFNFTPSSPLHGRYQSILRELASGADWRALTTRPAKATTTRRAASRPTSRPSSGPAGGR